jgi:hypothetical protein
MVRAGQPIPPEWLADAQYSGWQRARREQANPNRILVPGIINVSVGLGLMGMFSMMHPGAWLWSIGLIPLLLGLGLRQFSVRLPQTITALAGTGLVFGALSIALALQASPGAVQPLLVLVWVGTFVWSLVVDAHIYRRALSINMSLGMLVAVLIFALNFVAVEQLFPPEQIQG